MTSQPDIVFPSAAFPSAAFPPVSFAPVESESATTAPVMLDIVYPVPRVEVHLDSADSRSARDGRRARWDQHRADKRRELVQDTLRAIRKHGAGVGLDEICAFAGTSKTVIYRHFGDRAGLWAAVVESVHAYILSSFDAPLNSTKIDPTTLVLGLADAYLGVVERDPEIYRFVVTRPAGETTLNDPVGSFTSRIGALTSQNIRKHLRATGYPADQLGMADTWGHGVVGFIWAVADAWLAEGMQRPRTDILNDIATLAIPLLTPLSAAHPDPAHLVPGHINSGHINSSQVNPGLVTPAPSSAANLATTRN